ncbi:hypothetical protein Ahy_A03g011517 isoform E [Arachis hypogaea]|uniref:Uncharacterized protein n=1 Tax=Arachis hypogaea TaxID=3818 RepID=A0A445DR00_ARAHY|nr:hypothetical protein Ahy_A03g011517 isoform E [Arachis hypogaea]
MAAFTSSILAFSGSLNLRMNLPLLRSTRPGRSALNTCASGVSFQSTRVFTNAEFSEEVRELGNWKSLKGSQTSRENGSLLLPPKKLGISDIFSLFDD